jgi:hypothetical protein
MNYLAVLESEILVLVSEQRQIQRSEILVLVLEQSSKGRAKEYCTEKD